jgi:4-amino-4-deoxy-L-arabinose transferase-like glycosyltransferase
MKILKNIIFKIYRSRNLSLLFILLASLVASFAFMFFLGDTGPSEHAIPGTDYFNCYKPFADSILRGEGSYLPTDLPGHEGTFFVCNPPGYPLFLAVVFGFARLFNIGELNLIVYFNILVIALSACLLFLIVEHLFSRKISLISAFLWLSYPFNLWFIKNPNTEVFFIFLLLLGTWLFLSCLRKKKFEFVFFVGLVLGMVCLVRPIALFLPFVFSLSVFLLAREENLKKKILLVFLLMLGSLIPILIWEAGLLIITGQFIFLSSGGPPSIVDGLTFALKPGSAGNQVTVSGSLMNFMVRAETGNLDSFSKVVGFLGNELVEGPVTLIELIGWKLARSWYATSQMWWETKILLVQLVYLIFGGLGLIHLLRKCKSKMPEIIFLISIILYFWFMTVSALSILRYMVPAMAFVVIFSAAGAVLIIDPLLKKIFPRNEF